MRRTAAVAVSSVLLVSSCTALAGPTATTEGPHPPPSSTTTSEVRGGTTQDPSTTSTQPTHDVGLYRVDPATLTPIPGAEPLITGDWIGGYLSADGDWLALHVWVEPNTNLIRVIDTATGEIVTELPGELADFVGVSDDGTIYSMSYFEYQGPRLRKVAPGSNRFETVFDEFPSEFIYSESVAFLDAQRIAWFARFGGDVDRPEPGVVVLDLTTGVAATHMIEGMTIGDIAVTDIDEWSVFETVSPAVVWDGAHDRALLVHGDEEVVSILDLTTGEVSSHAWAAPTSFMDHLLTWLVPSARAKGPSSYGVVRDAALSPSGEMLYVATSVSQLLIESEEDWFIESNPRGVEVIDTTTWEVVDHLEIPSSEVVVSPDGRHLVTTGTAWSESLATSAHRPQGVFVIDTDTHEVVGQFEQADPWLEIQFSPDQSHVYLGYGRIDIVDLATMEVVGGARGSVFGEALLLSTLQP